MREERIFGGVCLPPPTKRQACHTDDGIDRKTALKHIADIILTELSKRNHDVGNDEYAWNTYCYQEDGWDVEIDYRLTGDWRYEDGEGWSPSFDYLADVDGDVDEIHISYANDETGESLEYDDEELSELRQEIIDEVIKSIPLY